VNCSVVFSSFGFNIQLVCLKLVAIIVYIINNWKLIMTLLFSSISWVY